MSKFWTVLLIGGLFLGMSGCTKDDIDDIRKELQEHGSRLTSLEEWQEAVGVAAVCQHEHRFFARADIRP